MTTDIELDRWSFVGIVTIFDKFDDDPRAEALAHQYFVSAWNVSFPGLSSFVTVHYVQSQL
jgi:hypothetical protein